MTEIRFTRDVYPFKQGEKTEVPEHKVKIWLAVPGVEIIHSETSVNPITPEIKQTGKTQNATDRSACEVPLPEKKEIKSESEIKKEIPVQKTKPEPEIPQIKEENTTETQPFEDMSNELAETISQLPEMFDKDIFFETNENGKTVFKAPILAKDICFNGENINRGFLVTNDNKKIYWYNGTYWEENGEDILRDITQQILGTKVCTRHKTEVISWIKDCYELQIRRDEFDNNTTKIGLENGVYDVITKEFLSFHPKYLLTSLFPFQYNSQANCPAFEKFISEIVEESDVHVLQEVLGYCFLTGYPIAAIFMLVGSGRNGKSTVLNAVISLLGKHNVSTASMQALTDENFSVKDLYRKYANICGDLTSKELNNTGQLKQLTGQDYIRARDLYEKSMKFVNYAKMIFSMNEIPHCHDTTLAWNQRLIVIEFPNTFLPGEEGTDPNIINELTTPEELTGIFNWAMKGLERLLKNGKFSPHKNLNDVEEYIATTKNSVLQFVKNHVEAEPENEILKDEVYKTFLQYAADNKLTTISSSHFSTKFKDYLMERKIDFTQGHLKAGRTWKGIKIKNPGEAETPSETGRKEAAGLNRYVGMQPDEITEMMNHE